MFTTIPSHLGVLMMQASHGAGAAQDIMLPQLHDRSAMVPGTALLFGLMLVAAIAGGSLAHLLRIPRVVGYLLAGIVLKGVLIWSLGIDLHGTSGVQLAASAHPLKAITDLGLGVILFSIGSVFEVRHFRAIGKKILTISVAETMTTMLMVFAGAAVVGLLLASPSNHRRAILSFALLLGFAAIATAPAATLFVIHEYDAKGPVSDMILALTGLNNIICIILFHACFSILSATGVLGAVEASVSSILIDLVTITLGSVLLGVLIGFVLSVCHAKLRLQDTLLILVAVLMVTGAGQAWLLEHHDISYNFLLLTLCMGATFANIAIDPSSLGNRLSEMSRPILVGFFVIAGYKLHLEDLADLQLYGLVYIMARVAGKILGVRLGLQWTGAGQSEGLPKMLGSAMLCQAAVIIGLADYVHSYWHDDWADRFVTVVLGSVVIFEIVGPLMTKRVVKKAGEVKAVTLLRRMGGASEKEPSTFMLSLRALAQATGLMRIKKHDGQTSGKASSSQGPLNASMVMRSNIKCIPAAADFDEVLHFIEQSRFNHFPVVDDQMNLVGIIHFRDIQEIIYDPHLADLMTAADIAAPSGKLVSIQTPLDEVLAIMQQRNLGSMPVVQSTEVPRVIGIIEARDVLHATHLTREKAPEHSEKTHAHDHEQVGKSA